MKPTLYYAPDTCALASHIALEEAQADVDYVRLDLHRGDTRNPAYLKLNPKGRVPVMITDRGVLSESPAILAWIAQTWPHANLAPVNDPWAFAQVNSFNTFLSGTLHGINYAAFFKPARFADSETTQAAVKEKAFQNIADTLAMIEDKLAVGGWVHGDAYTTSDAYLAVLFGWRRALGRPLPAFPKIAALEQRVLARPPVQRALATQTAPDAPMFNAA